MAFARFRGLMMWTIVMLGLWGCAAKPAAPVSLDPIPEESRRVVLVINDASDSSRRIGEYYMRKRKIPPSNVSHINCSMVEEIPTSEYNLVIAPKVRKTIRDCGNKIDFIVTTKGVPLRLREGGYSVDAFLATMDLDFKPMDKPDEESLRRSFNPYFNKREAFDSAKFKFWLVTRLDGYTVDHVTAMIDRGLNAKAEKGPFYFETAGNRNSGGYADLNNALRQTDKLMKAAGFESQLDESPEFKAPSGPVAGYCSWGSNDGKFNEAVYREIKFKPGAIAETFVSTSGRTFSVTSGGQSLIADLIAQGVTGVKGYVSEPFTFALARPEILFQSYTSGANLAESFYAASPLIKWKDVVIGDPLVRPYPRR